MNMIKLYIRSWHIYAVTYYIAVNAEFSYNTINCYLQKVSDDSARDIKRKSRLIRRASSVLRWPLDHVEVVSDRRVTAKLSSLLDNSSYSKQDTLTALSCSFSERYSSCIQVIPQVFPSICYHLQPAAAHNQRNTHTQTLIYMNTNI